MTNSLLCVGDARNAHTHTRIRPACSRGWPDQCGRSTEISAGHVRRATLRAALRRVGGIRALQTTTKY